MEKGKITAIKQQFDGIIHILDEGDVEYWLIAGADAATWIRALGKL